MSHSSPQTLLTAWNLRPVKQRGQNFLKESSTAEMIVVRSALSQKDIVLEIGAGLGALTVPLAQRVSKVYALEKDSRLIKLLKTELLVHQCNNAVVLCDDILKVGIDLLATENKRNLVIAGNLPYNISSQILVRLIHNRQFIDRAILMFQTEMARRITALPGSKIYGRLTPMLRYCADTTIIANIKAQMFYPKPRVDSQVLSINFHRDPRYPARDEALLFQVIKAAFSKRRKTLKNSLSGSQLHIASNNDLPEGNFQINVATAQHFLKQAGIDPQRRAETLSVEEFVKLSDCVKEYIIG
ncbi:16S rRNA (adenine(1518)-N(6)/adenine(1519)-N(6))-dimethyltransferase RsmA [Desulfococcaceae bacterium HSG7]|nr:16S rRNA (adenine(1518)-N(6)/adenine(1519)-N(6))-dimethyltransferase RsmA [Desulfococcaceae bacterium HSG7]